MGSNPFAKKSGQGNSPANRRRSTRVEYELPIIITGRDANGQTFCEKTTTSTLSLHGARLKAASEILVGMQVCIENPQNGKKENAVCVRVEQPPSADQDRYIAVQLVRPGNIWGLENPPADWKLEGTLTTMLEAALSPMVGARMNAADESGAAVPILDSQAVPWEVQSAALTESVLQMIRPQVHALMESVLQEFEARAKRVESETGARLEARSEKVLSDITMMVDSLRAELAKQLAAQGAEAIDSAEEDLRSRVAQILSPLVGLTNSGVSTPRLEPMAKK